jgi:hypothetical protein
MLPPKTTRIYACSTRQSSPSQFLHYAKTSTLSSHAITQNTARNWSPFNNLSRALMAYPSAALLTSPTVPGVRSRAQSLSEISKVNFERYATTWNINVPRSTRNENQPNCILRLDIEASGWTTVRLQKLWPNHPRAVFFVFHSAVR